MNELRFSLLVVDDDADDRFIIDEAFKEIDYEAEVKKFINGKYLMSYLDNIAPSLYPSLIVLDNSLSKPNAVDILSLLKNDPRYHEVRVVIYSTSLSSDQKEKLLEKGAYSCLEKGNVMKEIVEIARQFKKMADSNPAPLR